MHLDSSTLDGYLTRSLDRDRLATLDDHLDTCVACRLMVESEALRPDRWERRGLLGRLVPVAPPAQPARAAEEARAA
jgi:hypothetical protein